ncbi:hypothetical protein GN958_ATG20355 [Phytophthora infestans]|uniref:Secreted RxLR effector peptide protein n=1 Tax=Phytophthora infestans TaxID=4787 RepID=A0A8S9TPH6_PHYIN|nr:hypothetical protein GN958_ATG20355 [Phytophthora infestans]KAI9984967.1 hypothetical protein PInf_004271 [Phytophthora infestans]
MTKLNVILSFVAAALALATFDGVDAAGLRNNDFTERVLSSFDASASDSSDDDRFLFEMEGSDGSDVDSSDSFGGERLLQEIVEGSDSATDDEGSESTDGVRFLQEVDSSESVASERSLVEMEGSESADGSESFDGARFLQEVDSSESDADDSSESVDDERFLAAFESEEGSESGSA